MATQITTDRRAMVGGTRSSSASPKKVAFDIPGPGQRLGSWSGSTTPSVEFDDENDYHLTASQKRSRRALRALERLQPTSPNRLRLSLKLSPSPSRVSTPVSTPRPGILRKPSGTPFEVKKVRAIDDGVSKVGVPTPKQNTLKRRRQAPCPHDSDDPDEPSPIRKVSTNQQPLKRIRLHSKLQAKPSVEPSKVDAEALHMSNRPHPAEDRDDQWYTAMFRRLYRMTEGFVNQHFGMHDLTAAGVSHEPWAVNMLPEFLDWAEQVAEEDPQQEGWDGVLNNTRQRKWLIMGILMRIIKNKIFDAALWGSTEEQKKMMTGIERGLLSKEGFSRTKIRATTARTIVGQAPVTQNFFIEVAVLTAQISMILRPLSDHLSSIPLQDPTRMIPNSKCQYQSLHNIISTAAYLSICIRLSPSIFHFRDIRLGGAYDPEDQHNLEPGYYNLSKRNVLDQYTLAKTRWVESRSAALDTVQTLSDEGKEGTKLGRKAAQDLHDIIDSEPESPTQTHRPMCKMSVWPVITRYKAGSDEEDDLDTRGARKEVAEKDNQGFRIVRLGCAAVVCYFGETDRSGKASGRTSLQAHVEEKKRRARELEKESAYDRRRSRRGENGNWSAKGMATLAMVMAAGWVWNNILLGKTGIDFSGPVTAIFELASNMR